MKWLIDIILESFSGIIMIWAGLIADIPDGWVLCDGDNGTPDLRIRFVIGAGPAEEPGHTDGSIIHNHTFTANTHKHTIDTEIETNEGEEFETVEGSGGQADTNNTVVTGSTDQTNHMPPYYRILFIMKT